jgi:transcriptional regulator with XRE-family HTH domain
MPTRKRAPAATPADDVADGAAVGDSALFALAKQVRGWADTVIGLAGTATDLGLSLAQSAVKDPGKKAAVAEAGRLIRQWREAAGLTLDEVSEAVGLGDSALMSQAEGGIVALPFDVVLRLAGVLGRHDPIPVLMGLTRQYSPELWSSLEALGIGRLAVQGARERELANIYRRNDAARELDDAQFAVLLAFTRQAFETALALTVPPDRPAVPASAADAPEDAPEAAPRPRASRKKAAPAAPAAAAPSTRRNPAARKA